MFYRLLSNQPNNWATKKNPHISRCMRLVHALDYLSVQGKHSCMRGFSWQSTIFVDIVTVPIILLDKNIREISRRKWVQLIQVKNVSVWAYLYKGFAGCSQHWFIEQLCNIFWSDLQNIFPRRPSHLPSECWLINLLVWPTYLTVIHCSEHAV